MDGIDKYQFEFWERAAKAALHAPQADIIGPLTILHLAGAATSTACLVTVRKSPTGIFLPLRSGRNLVQRDYVEESEALRGVVEGAQWLIRLTPAGATIEDTRSTNGAALVRRANRESTLLSLAELYKDPKTCRIGWDGSDLHMAPQELSDGDILVNCYGPLMYCTSDSE